MDKGSVRGKWRKGTKLERERRPERKEEEKKEEEERRERVM